MRRVRNNLKQGGTSGDGSAGLTLVVIGHVAPHGVGPSLVHHPLHAVKRGRVWGARSHHAWRHALRVARWPGRRRKEPHL